MTTMLQPEVCDPVVNLGWITRQAESQIAQLCPIDRARITKTLLRSLPQNRCTLVGSLAKYRVYHFRASKSLRVSYRPTEQGLCIVHVGKHSEFDRFAQHFAGEPAVNIVPLQESPIMKNHQQVAKNIPVNSAPARPNVPPTAPAAGDEELLLLESLREVIGRALTPRHNALASDWTARLDTTRKEIEQTLQTHSKRLDQHDSRLNGLGNEHRARLAEMGRHVEAVSKSQQELAAQVAQSRAELDGRYEAQSRVLEEVRGETARQVNAARTELEDRLVALGDRLERRSQETDGRLAAVAESIESRDNAGKAAMARFDERVSGIDQRVGLLGEMLNDLAMTAQEQRRTIAGLQAALAQVSSQLEGLTAASKKPRSWRRLWNWARQSHWLSAMYTLRRPWRSKPTEPNGADTARLPLRRCTPATVANLDSGRVESTSGFHIVGRS